MKIKLTKVLHCLSLAAIVMVFPMFAALAQNTVTNPGGNTVQNEADKDVGKLTNPLKANSIVELINNAIDIFVFVAILAAVLMLIWTGLQYILARGDAKKIGELSQRMMWIVIGIAIILGSKLMIQIVIGTLESSKAVDSKVIQGARNVIK